MAAPGRRAGGPITKNIFVFATVLLVQTAAAHAQQSRVVPDGGTPAAEALPPAYAPPPGDKPPPAAAPQGAPPPRPRHKTNWWFTGGGGIGLGGVATLSSVTRDEGAAYTLRLGFGLGRRLILMWDLEGAAVWHAGSRLSQTANLAAVQVFATNRLFLKAGLGPSVVIRPDDTQSSTNWGAAAMTGIGYELIQRSNWSFDIETTVTGARYNSPGLFDALANYALVNIAINVFSARSP